MGISETVILHLKILKHPITKTSTQQHTTESHEKDGISEKMILHLEILKSPRFQHKKKHHNTPYNFTIHLRILSVVKNFDDEMMTLFVDTHPYKTVILATEKIFKKNEKKIL